jgi:hypothetical protein
MRDAIFAKIVSTKMEDSRFIEGENVEDSLTSNQQFGKSLQLFLDNGTFLTIVPVTDRWGESLIGCETGRWTTSEENPNEIVIVP